MLLHRGYTRIIASNVKEFEICNVGNNRFILAFRDSNNRLNLAAGHASSNGTNHLDTKITPFEIAPGKIFRIKRLCSIVSLTHPLFITFVVAVIDKERGTDHAFTFQVANNTIIRQTFVNEIAPSAGLPVPQHNAHFTPYLSSQLLYSTFPAHSSHKSGISLHEVEFHDGQTSYVTHDGKEFPGGSGNPLNVGSSKLQTGAIIHVGGRLFYVKVNGTRLEILDNISVEPSSVDSNQRSSAVIPTTNMGNIFSLLTQKALISYRIDDSGQIIKLQSVTFQNNAVSADQYLGDQIITSTGDILRLTLWRVSRHGTFTKVEETPGQEGGIEQVRITNLLNPLYVVGVKNREGELRLITWVIIPLPNSGVAWPQLESKVDALVENFFRSRRVPGMTVAVSIGPRVILSKGYGWARYLEIPMERDMHVKIGSVTKALVTGPAGWQLMESNDIIPATQKLFGPNGLFGNKYDEDIKMGIEEFANDSSFDSSKWMGWYRKITIQHLLNHLSGFSRDGSKAGAARMFNTTVDKLTHEELFKHFLRTKPLLFKPGTDPPPVKSYSNMGFAIWTLIVKKILSSTKDDAYINYVKNDYLQRIGVHKSIHPEKAPPPDSRDAGGYKFEISTSRNLSFLPFQNTRLAVAAGGFLASAQDMIRVMRYLKRNYMREDIDNKFDLINKMGWLGKDSLFHTGSVSSGGIAYAVMFRQSDICVALNANINSGSGNLRGLARNIALQVPGSNVPPHFNLMPELHLG